jgi:hypothetical protein
MALWQQAHGRVFAHGGPRSQPQARATFDVRYVIEPDVING